MADSYKNIESKIQNAIIALNDMTKPNISAIAREFGVPYHRLRSRFNGRRTRSQRPPTNLRLSAAQESAVCQYINTHDEMGLSPRPIYIEKCANSILAEAHKDPSSAPPKIGEHWLRRFLIRDPEYRRRRRRALDIERKRAHDRSVIQQWFNSYTETITQYGIGTSDIYKFDETGFQIGIGKDQWIITQEPKKKNFNGKLQIENQSLL